jgi:hypothetical protein
VKSLLHIGVRNGFTHYNLCRIGEPLRTYPGASRWGMAMLLAALAIEPNRPVRVKRNFTVFEASKI